MASSPNSAYILGNIYITPLLQANKSFNIAIQAPKTDLNRDATIQRFEYTFELAWKTLNRILKHKGLMANSPRDVLRESAKLNLIKNVKNWFKFLESRNQTSHVYNEADAERIYNSLGQFKLDMDQLITTLLSYE